jgi:hypothetical protein
MEKAIGGISDNCLALGGWRVSLENLEEWGIAKQGCPPPCWRTHWRSHWKVLLTLFCIDLRPRTTSCLLCSVASEFRLALNAKSR